MDIFQIITVVIATIGVFVSIVAFTVSWRTSRTSDKLNKMEIERRENEEADSKRAKLDLAHTRDLSGNCYFQLLNAGKSCAYNVEIEIWDVNKNESLLASNQNKTFTEIHPSRIPIKMPSGVHMGTSNEFRASLCWEDGQGKHEETRIIPR